MDLTRDELLAMAERAKQDKEAVWRGALARYEEARACGLGYCGRTLALDTLAETADTQEKREAAKVQASAVRAQARIAWEAVQRQVDQLIVTEREARRMADEGGVG